eukprot:CAMPEP_0172733618 /NCGR_PEP_ID=MMETSP1074-20121228/107617_1 /TAXON_ID=2916 /ORGANISM="Ceratium fusus, Strain PA161109" /LENGTH=100 /DNA_ID=CAMNT_0013562219 /DNA_START=24 /DNA_END=323 /DNA_ORIENTATION=+
MAADQIHRGDVQEMDARLYAGRQTGQITRRRDMHLERQKALHSRSPSLLQGRSSSQTFGESCFEASYVVKKSPTPREAGALGASPDRVQLSMTWIVKTLS